MQRLLPSNVDGARPHRKNNKSNGLREWTV